MNWTVKLSSKAEKYYKGLGKDTRSRIKNGLIELSELDDPMRAKNAIPLTGELRGFYKIRIGSYRIIISFLVEQQIIAVVKIGPRGDVYKK